MLEMGPPSLEPDKYGLVLIVDYADGDVVLRASGQAAARDVGRAGALSPFLPLVIVGNLRV